MKHAIKQGRIRGYFRRVLVGRGGDKKRLSMNLGKRSNVITNRKCQNKLMDSPTDKRTDRRTNKVGCKIVTKNIYIEKYYLILLDIIQVF